MAAGFLDGAHQALQARAKAAFAGLDAAAEGLDDAALAAQVAALGYYPHLVPAAFGGAAPKVSVLALCVLREELAYRSAAADSVYAVQGLGSHPVLLAGSPPGCARSWRSSCSTRIPRCPTWR